MTGAFAKFAPLTWKDKLSIAWAMLNILQTNGRTWDVNQHGGISMLEWLRRRHQTKGAIERFWRVVLVSALDEELEKTDARYGIDVFWKAFLSNRTGYRMGVPPSRSPNSMTAASPPSSKRAGKSLCAPPLASSKLKMAPLPPCNLMVAKSAPTLLSLPCPTLRLPISCPTK